MSRHPVAREAKRSKTHTVRRTRTLLQAVFDAALDSISEHPALGSSDILYLYALIQKLLLNQSLRGRPYNAPSASLLPARWSEIIRKGVGLSFDLHPHPDLSPREGEGFYISSCLRTHPAIGFDPRWRWFFLRRTRLRQISQFLRYTGISRSDQKYRLPPGYSR
jgi:hypothetical protein